MTYSNQAKEIAKLFVIECNKESKLYDKLITLNNNTIFEANQALNKVKYDSTKAKLTDVITSFNEYNNNIKKLNDVTKKQLAVSNEIVNGGEVTEDFVNVRQEQLLNMQVNHTAFTVETNISKRKLKIALMELNYSSLPQDEIDLSWLS